MTVFTRLLAAAAALSVVRIWAGAGHRAGAGQVFVLPSPAAAAPAAATSGLRAPQLPEASQGAAGLSVAATSAAAVAAVLALGLSQRPVSKPARCSVVACKAEASTAEVVDVDEDEDEDDEFEEDGDDEFYDDDEEDEDRLEAVCKSRYQIGSPYKFRRVLFQIKGKSYREALMMLEFLPWRACKPVLKALQSAAANAQNHLNMDKSRLYISRCRAEKGPYSKRMRPVSKGQAHGYSKKTTHLYIWVAEMEDDDIEAFE